MIDSKTKFVAVSIYTVKANSFSALTEAASETMQRDLPTLDGFCEGIVMADEMKTRVLVVTQWTSKHDWAQVHWEPRVGAAVANFVEGSTSYDVQTFEPITVVRAPD
ncbi:MAG TPA: hypothetical protein VMG98_05880 [Verrucomicrobiae bacterium]|nr:hypothetical protein [Verrucomicrobiae bacterium]